MSNELSRTFYHYFYYSGVVSPDFKHENNKGKDTGTALKYAGMNHYEFGKMFIFITMQFL